MKSQNFSCAIKKNLENPENLHLATISVFVFVFKKWNIFCVRKNVFSAN